MRVPVSWLRELVAVDATTSEIAERLAKSGTSVEDVERLGGVVAGVVVAEVVEVADVPESDKLCVARVDAGAAGRWQVVAGAKNFRAGDRVAWARPGSRVTTLDAPLGVRTMAGRYESHGMLCSSRELGVSEDHGGILALPPDAPIGADAAAYLALDDEVLVLEITPNRPDLLSILGVAREVSVLFDAPLRFDPPPVLEELGPAAEASSVDVLDAGACPRYLARVIEGVRFGPSPAPVQARLTACGMRPLGNLVDATNYVLLLTGQPLHAFDLDRLGEQRIVVRGAEPGETIRTLDDVERELDPADLVIADAKSAQAVAGVMGGSTSEVGPETTRVLLESAYFDPRRVAQTSRRLGLKSEASARFERGADPEMVPRAAAVCAELVRQWAGGGVRAGAVDVGQAPPRREIGLRRERVAAILGVDVPPAETERYLNGLGCQVAGTSTGWNAVIPPWRPDLEREIDLVEEVARLYGFDRVPQTLPMGRGGFLTRAQAGRRRIRQVLQGMGLSEATLPSFYADADLRAAGWTGPALELANPLSSEQGYLRPTLLPGLLRAAQRNHARGVEEVRLYEMGTVFGDWDSGDDLPRERLHVGAILTGRAEPLRWDTGDRAVDGLDAKGVAEALLEAMGVGEWSLSPADEMPLHPGRSALVVVAGKVAGRFGELRPSVREALDLPSGAAVLELAVDALLEAAVSSITVRELPRFPAVSRDLSLVVDEKISAGTVEETIRAAAGDLLASVVLFDVYRGQPIPAGGKNLAYRLTLRAPDRTLTSAEADAVRESVVAALAGRLGAEIR